MNKIEICEKIERSLIKIFVQNEQGKIISTGTGIFVDPSGMILTANHILKDNFGKTMQNVFGIPQKVGGRIKLNTVMSDFSFEIGDQDVIKPLKVDLALLKVPHGKDFSYLELEEKVPSKGTEIVMAGYPEDLATPLDIAKNIDMTNSFVGGNEEQLREFAKTIIPWVMYKHGIIGSVFPLYASNVHIDIFGSTKTFPLHTAEYWIDNTSVRGASGGPVVNSDGKLIGIITEQGETVVSDLTGVLSFPVPSGSTRVLSHKFLSWGIVELRPHIA